MTKELVICIIIVALIFVGNIVTQNYTNDSVYVASESLNKLRDELIKEYINSKGVLHNYHSFNYYIDNNKLLLNNKIVIPYQDMPLEQYKQILIS